VENIGNFGKLDIIGLDQDSPKGFADLNLQTVKKNQLTEATKRK